MTTVLLGLSIDSHYSQIAWIRNIKEKFRLKTPFPIIADLKMDVARAYRMILTGRQIPQPTRDIYHTSIRNHESNGLLGNE